MKTCKNSQLAPSGTVKPLPDLRPLPANLPLDAVASEGATYYW